MFWIILGRIDEVTSQLTDEDCLLLGAFEGQEGAFSFSSFSGVRTRIKVR